jgi:purine-binding chemotaxis protein CheW
MANGVSGRDAPILIVVFALGASRCALRHEEVREFLPVPHLWRPPGAPRVLEGFLNLGGAPVPVIALDRLLEVPGAGQPAPLAHRHLILLRAEPSGWQVALLVERVLDVRQVAPEQLRPAGGQHTLNDCVVAEIEAADGFVHLLAAERLMLAQERAALQELSAAVQARLSEWEVLPA